MLKKAITIASASLALASCGEPGVKPDATTAAATAGTTNASSTAASPGNPSPLRADNFTFVGRVKGEETRTHSFPAKKGDEITIEREGDAVMPYFNVLPPGGDPSDALFVGMMSDQHKWTGTAGADGSYSILVYLRGQAKDSGQIRPYVMRVSVK